MVSAVVGTTERLAPVRFYRWELDLLRVFAFLLVFGSHVLPARDLNGRPNGVVSVIADAGGFGVRLFFVLSAFLLTRLILIEQRTTGRVAVRNFYVRRLLRIWPLYFCFVGLTVAIGSRLYLPAVEPGHLVGELTFTQNWLQGLSFSGGSLSSSLWSLSVEEQMYVVWPLVLIWLAGRGRAYQGMVALCLLGLGSRVVVAGLHTAYPAMWVLTPTAFDSFALGGLAALLLERRCVTIAPRLRLSLAVASLVVLGAISAALGNRMYDGWYATWSYLTVNVACVAATMAALGGSAVSSPQPRNLVTRGLVWGGRRSYGFYVWHRLVIALVFVVVARTASAAIVAPLALVGTVAFATASYAFLEAPFLRLKRAFATVQSAPT